MENGTMIDLSSLAALLKDRYKGWYLHFGCCNTFDWDVSDLRYFKKQTGARLISGYKKISSWDDKYAALEIGLLSLFIYDGLTLHNDYNLLAKHLGLVMI